MHIIQSALERLIKRVGSGGVTNTEDRRFIYSEPFNDSRKHMRGLEGVGFIPVIYIVKYCLCRE